MPARLAKNIRFGLASQSNSCVWEIDPERYHYRENLHVSGAISLQEDIRETFADRLGFTTDHSTT
jgi:hypothetical protein